MSLTAHAEASANGSSIPAQGTSPLTASTERIIKADSGYHGDEPSGQHPPGPLTSEQKDQLILSAIQKDVSYPIRTWGDTDLYNLLSYGAHNYVGIEECQTFFQELLLFVAIPRIAPEFDVAVDDGLKIIGRLSKFFRDLASNNHFRNFSDYLDIEMGVEDEKYDNIARRYLKGAELESVLAPVEETKTTSRSWYMTPEQDPLPNLSDDELVAALDRHYPGKQWPADKRTIAMHDKMRSSLTWREKDRLSLLHETPEQKQKRLIDAAVHSVIDAPSLPALIRAVGEKVEAAKSGATVKRPANTPVRNPVPPKKPAPARKPASKTTSPKKKA